VFEEVELSEGISDWALSITEKILKECPVARIGAIPIASPAALSYY